MLDRWPAALLHHWWSCNIPEERREVGRGGIGQGGCGYGSSLCCSILSSLLSQLAQYGPPRFCAYSKAGAELRKSIATSCCLPRVKEQMLPFPEETSSGIPLGLGSSGHHFGATRFRIGLHPVMNWISPDSQLIVSATTLHTH